MSTLTSSDCCNFCHLCEVCRWTLCSSWIREQFSRKTAIGVIYFIWCFKKAFHNILKPIFVKVVQYHFPFLIIFFFFLMKNHDEILWLFKGWSRFILARNKNYMNFHIFKHTHTQNPKESKLSLQLKI